jgi:hypothetical protein
VAVAVNAGLALVFPGSMPVKLAIAARLAIVAVVAAISTIGWVCWVAFLMVFSIGR